MFSAVYSLFALVVMLPTDIYAPGVYDLWERRKHDGIVNRVEIRRCGCRGCSSSFYRWYLGA